MFRSQRISIVNDQDAILRPLIDALSAATGTALTKANLQTLAIGNPVSSCVLECAERKFFIKTTSRDEFNRLEGEALGLNALSATNTVKVPALISIGTTDKTAYLALDYLDLRPKTKASAAALGESLARLHRNSAPEFGWGSDNHIGGSPQRNTWCGNWIEFWRDARLGALLPRAAGSLGSALTRQVESILARCDTLLHHHQPPPSLLHGDLWGGNWGVDPEGRPVVFDPAAYFGDREADIAMTGLFGGFTQDFYAAYSSAWPLDPGFEDRKDLYNLYHLLNHLALFGPGYLELTQATVNRILGKIG